MKHSVMLKAWSKMLRPYVEALMRDMKVGTKKFFILRDAREEKQPRVIGRQQNRSNHQSNSPKEY